MLLHINTSLFFVSLLPPNFEGRIYAEGISSILDAEATGGEINNYFSSPEGGYLSFQQQLKLEC